MTDGAVDADYGEGLQDYYDRVADALEDVPGEPVVGGCAIDIVTRQVVYVVDRVADSCVEYYDAEGFDLVTYKMHPFLPGISVENAVYECVYVDGNPQNTHKPGRTYDFPTARLMPFPVGIATDTYEVGGV
ncbi:hypothetical protein HSTV1_35 [Haloarcula sinaiiensis tailed virus 1]|uniref:Uncharacterized protein n=1 Tax=Haloarcula sinaiiensis tailed virus 1 TaxID=1262530 RepID=R9QTN3_9CAUD|nr:hypothetical protein HSTV1_35 [Haloarcula sinaiiensis tailed virus 1]AGC34580.1 hypothetical protein HSTV1_35 [Haloarcula sinaiiensis tailed virus 1]